MTEPQFHPNELLKLMRHGGCALALALLTGCVPYPHTSPRSWEVSGTVLDARTRAPIKGANVVQEERATSYPAQTRRRTTAAAGHFRLKASHNFHLAAVIDGEGWPRAHFYDVVTISHPNYLSYEIKGWGKEMTILLQLNQ